MSISIFEKTEKDKDQNILVGATVIAAMAYQAAISPPGSVAAMDSAVSLAPAQQDAYKYKLQPGSSLLAYFYSDLSNVFWIFNTISLMSSLSVIFLYVSGFSLRRTIEIWLIRVAMWITLSSMTVAYVCAVIATTPSPSIEEFSDTFTMGGIALSFLFGASFSLRTLLVEEMQYKWSLGVNKKIRPNRSFVSTNYHACMS